MRPVTLLLAVTLAVVSVPHSAAAQGHDGPVSFVRCEYQGRTSYGVLDGDHIRCCLPLSLRRSSPWG